MYVPGACNLVERTSVFFSAPSVLVADLYAGTCELVLTDVRKTSTIEKIKTNGMNIS